jgi:ubiquinone/menaquinone biosynthesis C-methylase UbiE
MSQLEFGPEIVEQLERVYKGRDVLRRRALVHEALGAQPGDRVLDVGCGPGFFVTEILDAVGPEGSVVGIDLSPDMLAVAAKRAESYPNVEFAESSAVPLPVADAGFDRALSVQVLEYVDDVPAALRELHRALRPGGRLVVWDVDWSTVSLQSADTARMRRVLDAWDEHLTDPFLPRTLAGQLRDAGFDDVAMQGHVFATNELDPETYGGYLVPLIRDYVVGGGLVNAGDADAWVAEQRELAEAGRFYFTVTQFCFTATRPG